MPELQLLREDHRVPLLAFETENREWFARSISDRGDEFFEQFTERLEVLLTEQEAGTGAFYVLVGEDGSVLGRFNLELEGDGVGKLGYRVAEAVAGRGLATATVLELCALAADRHGLRTLRAATSTANVASQRVLLKAGFAETGPADPSEIGGKQGSWYQRDVSGMPCGKSKSRSGS
jgi:ribosomal-protein-alanine N-acetyltransferase